MSEQRKQPTSQKPTPKPQPLTKPGRENGTGTRLVVRIQKENVKPQGTATIKTGG